MKQISLILLAFLWLAACGDDTSKIAFEDLPAEGDPARGEALFGQSVDRAAPCNSCHMLDGQDTASPGLVGFGEHAGSRVDGQSAREYAFYSIVEPGRYLVENFGNAMPNNYDDKLSPQQIADLIAYLLTL